MGRNARAQIQCFVCWSLGCVGMAGPKSTAARFVGGNNRERAHVRNSGINRSHVNIESQAARRVAWPEPRAPSFVHMRFPIFITIGGPRKCLCLRIAIATTKGLEQSDLSPGPCCHQFQHRICGAVSETNAVVSLAFASWRNIRRGRKCKFHPGALQHRAAPVGFRQPLAQFRPPLAQLQAAHLVLQLAPRVSNKPFVFPQFLVSPISIRIAWNTITQTQDAHMGLTRPN